MTSILFGLAAALCWGFVDVLAAIYSRRHGTLKAVSVASVGSLAAYLIAVALFPQRFSLSPKDLWWFASVGAVITFTYLAFYGALRRGPLSVVTPIMSSYAALIVLFSVVLLGEDLSAWELVGSTLAMAGVIGCSIKPSQEGKVPASGTGLALLAMVGFAVSGFAGGILAKQHGWLVPPVATRVIITVFLFLIVLQRRPFSGEARERKAMGIPDIAAMLGIGVIEGIGFLAFSRGAEVGLISLVAVASAAYPLIPVALGVWLFKEKLGPLQLSGALAVFLGLVVLGSAQ